MLLPESHLEAIPCLPQQADYAYTRHYTHNFKVFRCITRKKGPR